MFSTGFLRVLEYICIGSAVVTVVLVLVLRFRWRRGKSLRVP